MRLTFRLGVLNLCLAAMVSVGNAQQSRERPSDRPKPVPQDAPASTSNVDAFVDRMMVFDKNKDGKLDRDEITDRRLLRLFDRADADKDKVVTKDELVALATQLAAEERADGGGRRGGGPGGPGDRGGPNGGPGGDPGRRPRGPGGGPGGDPGGDPGGGPGGFGPPPQPGQILPGFLQQTLNLTAEQRKQIDDLQKDVDARLDKILTAEQKKQLKEMRNRGPGGNGPRPVPPDDDGPPPGPRARNGQPPGPEGADNPPRR